MLISLFPSAKRVPEYLFTFSSTSFRNYIFYSHIKSTFSFFFYEFLVLVSRLDEMLHETILYVMV